MSDLNRDFEEMDRDEKQEEVHTHDIAREIGSLRTDLDLLGRQPDEIVRRLRQLADESGWEIHEVATRFSRKVEDPAWQAKIDAVVEALRK